MRKLSSLRIPVLMALFLGLCLGAWSQQQSEATPGLSSEQAEAKKKLYNEAGVEWNYQDGASLDAAKEAIVNKQVRGSFYSGSVSPEMKAKQELVAKMATEMEAKQRAVEFEANKADWFQNHPEKYEAYAKSLQGDSKMEISAEEYKTFPSEKKAHIDANPALYNVVSELSTK